MSDPADRAQPEEEALLAKALAKALEAQPSLPYTGLCHNCKEEVPQGFRFCPDEDDPNDSSDCRDDYDYRMNRGKVNGYVR